MEFGVEDIKGILTKMNVEFTPGITQDRAEAKLGRAVQERNISIPWAQLTKREMEVLGEMGFESTEPVKPIDEKPKPVFVPAPKPKVADALNPIVEEPKEELVEKQEEVKTSPPSGVNPDRIVAQNPAPTPAPAAPRKRSETSVTAQLKKLFHTSGVSIPRKELTAKYVEWGCAEWTILNYISWAKKENWLGFLLKEEKDKEGKKHIIRI